MVLRYLSAANRNAAQLCTVKKEVTLMPARNRETADEKAARLEEERVRAVEKEARRDAWERANTARRDEVRKAWANTKDAQRVFPEAYDVKDLRRRVEYKSTPGVDVTQPPPEAVARFEKALKALSAQKASPAGLKRIPPIKPHKLARKEPKKFDPRDLKTSAPVVKRVPKGEERAGGAV
jgi:hypothetical protein